MRTMSVAALASMFSQHTAEAWLTLMTLDHASLGSPIRLVNNTEAIVSAGESFSACPFQFVFPSEDAETIGEANVEIDGVDQSIVASVRQIASPLDAVIEVVLADSPDTVEVRISGLKLRNVEYDAHRITGTLRFEDVMVEPATLTMTPQRFPGIF